MHIISKSRSDWLASESIHWPANQNVRFKIKWFCFHVKVAYLSYGEYTNVPMNQQKQDLGPRENENHRCRLDLAIFDSTLH